MKYGYARVSSQDQNLDRQIDALKAEGIRQIDIYSDKKSGKDLKRKGLTEVLERLQENDELVITSLDRLIKSLLDNCFKKSGLLIDSISILTFSFILLFLYYFSTILILLQCSSVVWRVCVSPIFITTGKRHRLRG